MNLTEWIQRFFNDVFSAPAEKTSTPAKLDDTWPHGHSWDPLGLNTYEEKEQILRERLEQAGVDDLGIQQPRELLPVTWPDGTTFNTLKPFWIEETGKTYETLDEAVEDMGQIPSHNSFGALKF